MERIEAFPWRKSEWKRNKKVALSFIYNKWKKYPKMLNYFVTFLRNGKSVELDTFLDGGKDAFKEKKAMEEFLKDFGFDLGKTLTIPAYKDEILSLTAPSAPPSTSSNDKEILKKVEELERMLEAAKRKLKECEESQTRPAPPAPKKTPAPPAPSTPPPPPPYDSDEEMSSSSSPPSSPEPPPRPPAPTTTPVVKKDGGGSLQEEVKKGTTLKKGKTVNKSDAPETKKGGLEEAFKGIQGRRGAIAGNEDKKDNGDVKEDEWVDRKVGSCVICNSISFTKCSCCNEVYCTSICQRINH